MTGTGLAPVVRCQGHDTWEYDGFAWRKISISGPTARNHCAMVYNIKNKGTVLFGGHDGENIFGDTWAFADKTWTLLRKMEFMARIKHNY